VTKSDTDILQGEIFADYVTAKYLVMCL